MRTQAMPSWKDAVRTYCVEWLAYEKRVGNDGIPPGANDAEIGDLRRQFELRGLHLDHEIVAMLRIVNGTSYDGLNLYGASVKADDPYDRSDLVESNDAYNDRPGRYTLYGSWDIDLYRFDNLTREFQVLDNGGGGVVQCFSTYGALVWWAIATHVRQADWENRRND